MIIQRTYINLPVMENYGNIWNMVIITNDVANDLTREEVYVNSINVIGRLTRDPELRETSEGKSVCNFSLAVNDVHSKEDRADFIRCTVFGVQGEKCEKHLKKGVLTGVSGRIRSDTYKDSEGITRYPVSIIADRVKFLEWPDKTDKKDS